MSQYDELDRLIIERLTIGRVDFKQMWTGERTMECQRIADATGHEPYRILDKRLQALRKRGVIEYSRGGGWGLP